MGRKENINVDKDGVVAIIMHNRKILLLRRICLPFISHPGLWSGVSGAREEGESYIETAYREIKEETGIGKEDLKPLSKGMRITLCDHKKPIQWRNTLFIFAASNAKVKLNFENREYKWVTISRLKKESNTTLDFCKEKDKVLDAIRSATIKNVKGRRV